MALVGIQAVLLPAAALVAASAANDPVSWGPPTDGLSLQVAVAESQIPMGGALDLELLFRYEPSASTSVRYLTLENRAWSARADTYTISAQAGGTQRLSFAGGPRLANRRYLVAGSLTGIGPSVPLQTYELPLVFDHWSWTTILSKWRRTIRFPKGCGRTRRASWRRSTRARH